MMDLLHQVPIDRNAQRVISKTSIDNEFYSTFRTKNLGVSYWSSPKPHTDLPNTCNFSDLTGTTFGRLKVIGYLGKKKWQCRCSCGYFVKRKTSAILKALDDPSQMCPECYELCIIKKRDIQRRTGKHAEWHEI